MWHGLAHISPPEGSPTSHSSRSVTSTSFPHRIPALCLCSDACSPHCFLRPPPDWVPLGGGAWLPLWVPSGWTRAECKSSEPSHAAGYCQPSRCLLRKMTAKAIPGHVKHAFPWNCLERGCSCPEHWELWLTEPQRGDPVGGWGAHRPQKPQLPDMPLLLLSYKLMFQKTFYLFIFFIFFFLNKAL